MQYSKWVTLGFGALCLVAVAGVINAPHLYYMAAILLTLPGVSYTLGWFALRGLAFSRELPASAWEGEESQIVYSAQNRTRVARFFLSAHEALPSWIVPLDLESPLFNVAANDTARVVHQVRFDRRGVFRPLGFEVTAMDPLGVFAFTRRVSCPGEMVIYPLPQQMRSMPVSGTERYGFQEYTSLALNGSSVDPDGVRQYVPGDSLRRIHWRQTARTGKLSVIEFEESQSVNLVIALDLLQGTDIGAGKETTLEYAVRLAASLGQQATQQGASVRLLVPEIPGGEATSLMMVSQAGRGQSHFFLLLDALARVEATATQSVSDLITNAAGTLLPGTTLVVLTSRASVALPAALARYTATGANVIVTYIDPETFPGGRGSARPAETQAFFAEVLAVQSRLFVLRQDPQGELNPEVIADADIRTPQPALV